MGLPYLSRLSASPTEREKSVLGHVPFFHAGALCPMWHRTKPSPLFGILFTDHIIHYKFRKIKYFYAFFFNLQ